MCNGDATSRKGDQISTFTGNWNSSMWLLPDHTANEPLKACQQRRRHGETVSLLHQPTASSLYKGFSKQYSLAIISLLPFFFSFFFSEHSLVKRMAKPSKTAERVSPSAAPTSAPHLASFFDSPSLLYLSALLLRLVFLVYGLWQDANSPVKYTDIDYLVFTDAARFVAGGQSPYERETYRYTPILAWLLLPTAQTTGIRLVDAALFSSGKVLFAAADLVAGWLLERVLAKSMDGASARKFAAIWLLNPMVATISTRGSSEGILGALVMALLSAVLARRITLAGLLLGFSVHFKIYPFIYAPAIVWWMDADKLRTSGSGSRSSGGGSLLNKLLAFITPARLQLAITSLATFLALNVAMYTL